MTVDNEIGAGPGGNEPGDDGPAAYLTLGSFESAELIIRRSRFICWGAPVDSEDEALAVIENIRSEHPQATHHCYAYRAGLGAETIRFNDDGEPGGTAGRPILEVLQREELRNALVVVTRYFGGIQLGAGGLVRAYAQSAKLAIDTARIVRQVLHTRVQCDVDYESFGRVQHALQERGVIVEEAQYGEHVALHLLVRSEQVDDVAALLRELTNGQAEPHILTQLYQPLEV